MTWSDQLLDEQKSAATHTGSHVRLLAGPGTGKTLTITRRVLYLIEELNVSPDKILCITFTRSACNELRQRLKSVLKSENLPYIATLHSFALQQLLRNSSQIKTLTQPLRIADDWEEKNLILQDIRSKLRLDKVKKAGVLLNNLSSDWQSLKADEDDWEKRFPNPKFLGMWQEHRRIYGYTLRSEIVYQLKKAFEQHTSLTLSSSPQFIIVDEYQDLNRCDLSVINSIASQDIELYVAGDDDQSIYGFRNADPEGIRRFSSDYYDSRTFQLETCMRCDRYILELGLFVAKQDTERIYKSIHPKNNCDDGTVEILKFRNQNDEARGIADLCFYLINTEKLAPKDILILLRSDRNGIYSRTILTKMSKRNISATTNQNSLDIFNEDDGRTLLSFMRIFVDQEDSLAWRSLLKTFSKGVGDATINYIYKLALDRQEKFAQSIMAIQKDNSLLDTRIRNRTCKAIDEIFEKLECIKTLMNRDIGVQNSSELIESIQEVAKLLLPEERSNNLIEKIGQILIKNDVVSIDELIREIQINNKNIEQSIEDDTVNIITMHQAKGLTAEAVIIAVAEDEIIPGENTGDKLGDERRLLYVSLTRAKHHLYITYCNQRTGRQIHSGRESGNSNRSLTQFLAGGPYSPKDGNRYIGSL